MLARPSRSKAIRFRLTQVLLANLRNNAAKYTPERGKITLTAQSATPGESCRSATAGRALAGDAAARVRLFTQGPPATSQAQGGLGIG